MAAKLTLLAVISCGVVSGQQAPPDFSGQYHIQTDLGGERFFRFQTHTGQYRKEAQRSDGSVEGTYGWVDPNGVLRLFEYVADNLGYRIEKETLYQLGAPSPGATVAVRGGELSLGFEVYPLDGDAPVNRQAGGVAQRINIADGQFDSKLPYVVSSLTNTNDHLNPNPVSKQAQATFFSGAPAPPPPPRRIVIGAEDTPPAPEPEQTFVVGHTGRSKTPEPRPESPTFVIGLSHNGESASAAAAAPRRPATPQTRPVPRPQTRPAPKPQPRNFIVIGSSRRRRRFVQF
eukprot:TRINITY_DN32065_c0_g1_i2.p1 TRINITY_DN32065_c0_g1~~TRINITY_DN32065_c0_g1_i2.p1  ORF type:complete len:288 (-),score=59.00 TRINITY_DN32065_c0_g1_i2:74-937(-)